jgi:predicted dehydrogenase
MNENLSRRSFLKTSSVITASLATASWARAQPTQKPNDKIVVGVIGCNGRGQDHIRGHLSGPNVEIGYICDVDSRAVEKGIAAVGKKQSKAPKGMKDLRKMLEDPHLDAVSIAMPDHWHTTAALMALSAGKHVYVEKPGSHNGHESELLVAGARKSGKQVQMGNQRRSWPWVIEAMQALHGGELGKVFFARAWYMNHRASIGRGKPAPVPEWLDYSLWQGPAPERPYHDNTLHYTWHWFWNWGTGELGNNGVHFLDLARWGLQVNSSPLRIVCGGNRYHFQDDQETPDIYTVNFDFGDKGIAWEGRSCDPHGFEGAKVGVNFYGEKGCLSIADNDCKIFDLNDKLVREIKGKFDDSLHFQNFADAIRTGKTLTAPIEDGQRSTMLCHLGNIAWRSGHTVNCSPDGKIIQDKTALAFWHRSYRRGWEPKV